MDIISIFIIGFGLSMDAFAVSVTNGITENKSSNGLKTAICCALLFGFFQGLMPFIGWAIGVRFSSIISSFDHWIAFGLLAIIGIGMLKEAFENNSICSVRKSSIKIKTMLIMAVATSVDALMAGVTMAFMGATTISSILFAAGVIATITGSLCFLGFWVGRFIGGRWNKCAQAVGGFVLIALGIKILIEHLFIS